MPVSAQPQLWGVTSTLPDLIFSQVPEVGTQDPTVGRLVLWQALNCLRCLSSLNGLTVSMNLLILDFSLTPNSHYSEFFLSGKSLRAIWVSKVRAMIPGERYAGVSRASSHDAFNNQLAYHLASVTELMASGPEGHFCDTTSP